MISIRTLTPSVVRPTAKRDTPGSHPWMGQPLAMIDEAELTLILETLEEVAFGERRTKARLPKAALIRRIWEIDVMLEPMRPL